MAGGNWKNRIVSTGAESPEQLLANPLNWRIHPEFQQKSLKAVLDDIGWVQSVIVNKRTGHLVDGHLRVTLAMRQGAETIPVHYVDLSEDEEKVILATLDPLAGLAVPGMDILEGLLGEIETNDVALKELLASIAIKAGVTSPNFLPGSIDDQGKLDQKAKVICPECGHEF